uniref:Uncharacterized protein n=1 Tax=Arundo donax TaxID=35708 RepID=A0A0A9F9M8_ARUDO
MSICTCLGGAHSMLVVSLVKTYYLSYMIGLSSITKKGEIESASRP